ncbi:S1C family serine protease [Sporosarcina pasteurii]|uniref:Serine protease HtrA n=1 Tax=Sporosarcina pasteurii TaxID=1474 RepID=A0A380C9N7_SPOPA|nr:serine protease [Sporosarcina pasteurii]MDS9473007.1 serine protease [Sporosarcina pasteurii]QBQ04516.1 serine protease [Sporosarcina pasteurii]SUJ14282.1 Putative serine protease HtrA [Sporosarcina pasteurii]
MKDDHHSSDELTEEEFIELVLEEQQEALRKARLEKDAPKPKRPFPRWTFWIMALVLTFSTFSAIFEVYSIPAIEFLKTSAKLSQDEEIADFKKSVVVVTTDDGKGTGFSITSDGKIITNYHVIEGNNRVIVTFPDDGRFTATVVDTFPTIDLAVLQVDGKNLPFLTVADEIDFSTEAPIRFIGNPLSFHGIANEGTLLDFTQLSDWDKEVMMIQAPVYRGNSGSPVFNQNGDVIGVIFATMTDHTYGKIGLVVPIEYFHQAHEKPGEE